MPLRAASSAPQEARVDAQSIIHSSETLSAAIREAISQAGGDPEYQHCHLVLGFSTGHFAEDPLGAEAARGIAGRIVRDFLVKGDQLSVYAWEQHLWKHPQVDKNPTTIISDDASRKAKLQDLFPLTPQTGSQGGHDTERALIEITQQLTNSQDVVIVLLTNSAASVSTPGQVVTGSDDAEYQKLLQHWRRIGQVNQTGASLVLPYSVTISRGQAARLRSIDAVIMTPDNFVGAPIASGTRDSHLHQRHDSRRSNATSSSSPWGTLVLISALVFGGLIAYSKLVVRGSRVLEINGQSYDLSSVPEGGEICHLAGVNYPAACEKTVTVSAPDQSIPPLRLARVMKMRGQAVVEGDKLKLNTFDGTVTARAIIFPDGRAHQLVFRGEWAPDLALPPQALRIEVAATLRRSSHRIGGA